MLGASADTSRCKSAGSVAQGMLGPLDPPSSSPLFTVPTSSHDVGQTHVMACRFAISSDMQCQSQHDGGVTMQAKPTEPA